MRYSTKASALAEATRIASFQIAAYRKGAANLIESVKDGARYKRNLPKISWMSFVGKADYAYFVARVLLVNHVRTYGMFCGQQCVENYLKAFLKKANNTTPQRHSLIKLLEAARAAADTSSFLHSEHAEVICMTFEPFYEYARYPAYQSGPREPSYAWISGVDELMLDYFVYQIRLEVQLPADSWDVLTDRGHFDLEMCAELKPDFYRSFTEGNLNFLP